MVTLLSTINKLCQTTMVCVLQIVSYEQSGAKAVVRTCGTGLCSEVGETDISYAGISGADLNCCNTEDCNSAASLLPALSMLFASLLFTALF